LNHSARATERSVRPLERKLFLTIVAGMFPLAVLALAVLLSNAREQRQELLDSEQGAMRAVVAAVDAELEAAVASLDALAASPRLASDDLTGFHAEARELLSRRPGWANIVLSDAAANQLLNARLPAGARLSSNTYADGVQQAARSGKPVVSDITYSDVLETYVFAVQIPIRRDAQITHVLSAALHPDAVRNIIRNQQVPAEGLVSVFDTAHNIVARTLNHEETVGRPASPGLYRLLEGGMRFGSTLTETIEGVRVHTVVYQSPTSGWTAAVGLPTHIVDAPMTRSYLVFGGLVLGSVLLGLGAALYVSRAITTPMRALKLAAEALARGHAPEPPATDLPEIRNVAEALVDAHTEREKLLAAEREAREHEHQARLSAERANKLKDEFLAMLGHELRNPLAAISSAAQVLELSAGRPDAAATAGNATRIIRRQSQQLARLTDDLLDAGRVVLGRIQLHRRPLDLAAVVRGCIETLSNANGLEGYEVIVALEPAWIDGDPTRIEQIVTNLLTNAVKYTPSPGTIEVRVQRVDHQSVLRVRDSGIGIEPDLLPRIFDLFVQGARAPDRAQGGLGIGLTMVRRLAELHGGRVQVTSAGTDCGSEFEVTFQAIEPQTATPELARALPGAPCSVVLVEDNIDVQSSLKALLELEGHRVTVATDGRAGIELIARTRPELALVDIGLPVVDGYAVAREIRERAELASTFLVAMSGYGTPEDRTVGLEAGFDAYLVKPVDETKLSDVLGRARQAAESLAR
jgi:signal transduction histidine kinase/ActR/RegA family two-component response regulator